MSCLLPWCCSFRYTGRYTQSASINRCFFVWASCCLPGTSCQSLNLHSCVYHRASESGSASWPTTAAGQKILSAFGITCNLTLQMCLWNFPASNTVVAYIQAPDCRASASTMSFGQTPWMLLSTSDEPLSSMGGLVNRGLRRRNRLRLGLPHARALVRGLRKEEQDFLHRLVLPPGSDGSRRAVQHRDLAHWHIRVWGCRWLSLEHANGACWKSCFDTGLVRSFPLGAYRRDDHVRQRGPLRHLPQDPRRSIISSLRAY